MARLSRHREVRATAVPERRRGLRVQFSRSSLAVAWALGVFRRALEKFALPHGVDRRWAERGSSPAARARALMTKWGER